MPFNTVTAQVTIPSEYEPEVHEALDQAIDQLAIRNIPVLDSEVSEECADSPETEDTD